jgi:hypothetical protein
MITTHHKKFSPTDEKAANGFLVRHSTGRPLQSKIFFIWRAKLNRLVFNPLVVFHPLGIFSFAEKIQLIKTHR